MIWEHHYQLADAVPTSLQTHKRHKSWVFYKQPWCVLLIFIVGRYSCYRQPTKRVLETQIGLTLSTTCTQPNGLKIKHQNSWGLHQHNLDCAFYSIFSITRRT